LRHHLGLLVTIVFEIHMKKIYILHENPIWMIPLREALEEQGLPYQEWLLDEGLDRFTNNPLLQLLGLFLKANNYKFI